MVNVLFVRIDPCKILDVKSVRIVNSICKAIQSLDTLRTNREET